MKQSSSFFQNTSCEYFPCHEGVKKEDFNCLFCYCPLYALGRDCGGNFYYTEKKVKVCTECNFVHKRENYKEVLKRVRTLVNRLAEIENEGR